MTTDIQPDVPLISHPAAQLQHDAQRFIAWGCCAVVVFDRAAVLRVAATIGVNTILVNHGVDPARAELRWYDDGSLIVLAARGSAVLS